MSTAFKVEALAALACALVAAAPDLDGKVCVGKGRPGHKLGFPSLAIKAVRFTFKPGDEMHQLDLNYNTSLWSVGNWRGIVQLVITAATQEQRYYLEQQVTQAFGRLGVIVAMANPGIACAFELDSSEWRDDDSMEQSHGATVVVNAIIPAIVCASPVYTLKHLYLGLSADIQPAATETIEVTADT